MPTTWVEVTEVAPNAVIEPQVWNTLIDAIEQLYEACGRLQAQAPGYVIANVLGADTNAPVPEGQIFRVSAAPVGAPQDPRPGQRVRESYLVPELPPGQYQVTVVPTEASGYAAQTAPATVAPGGPAVVDVTLAVAGTRAGLPVVPPLFGRRLQEALDQLFSRRLPLGEVLDAHGNAVPVQQDAGAYTAPADRAADLVTGSEPAAGTPLVAGESVSLLIAARLPGA
jgi:hypothetical protein